MTSTSTGRSLHLHLCWLSITTWRTAITGHNQGDHEVESEVEAEADPRVDREVPED